MSARSSRTSCAPPRALGVVALLVLAGCGDDAVTPADPVSEEIIVTDQMHHIGDNSGAEGVDYSSTFTISQAFDSVNVAITFLFPNTQGVSGPEIENTKMFVNAMEIGITAGTFPNDPLCVTGTGSGREYSCDLTLSVPAAGAATVGTNSIRVATEAATPLSSSPSDAGAPDWARMMSRYPKRPSWRDSVNGAAWTRDRNINGSPIVAVGVVIAAIMFTRSRGSLSSSGSSWG